MNLRTINKYRNGYRVERLHTVPHHTPYNNGNHSANAAMIGYELAKINHLKTSDIILALLLHDLHEADLGDIPAPMKRSSPEISKCISKAESNWDSHNIPDYPALCQASKEVVKAADIMELGLYCLDELQMGNKHIIHVLKNVIRYLEPYDHIIGVGGIVTLFKDELIKYES